MNMRKTAIFLFAFLTAYPLPKAAGSEYKCVFTAKANVRSGPGTGYEILASVKRYTPFKILEKKRSWYRVSDFEGATGWIHSSLLSGTPCMIVKTNKANLRAKPKGAVLWVLKKTYPLEYVGRKGSWFHVKDGEVDGWLHVSTIWGFTGSE